ncbi:MAG: hypothetical protein AAGB31_12245 [Bdellovibrio sp.]
MKNYFLFFILSLIGSLSYAAHQYEDIDTCYHWLEPSQLRAKLDYARSNNGKLAFYGNGPIYCWRSPLGAVSRWEIHGSYLIRIKFKSNTKVAHAPRGNIGYMMSIAPVIYSNDNSWHEYTITPEAVESWSVFHPRLLQEMTAELKHYASDDVNENDVFYPFQYFSLSYTKDRYDQAMALFQTEIKNGRTYIGGEKPENHFLTKMKLPWQKYVAREKVYKKTQLDKIKIIQASYGENLSKQNRGNATVKAGEFCDDKYFCNYKVSSRFIDDPDPDSIKSFTIKWICGDDKNDIKKIDMPAPATDKILELSCFE